MTFKKRSQKQEKSVASDFNAKVTVASGAKWGMKGDVRSEKYLIECKTTEKDFYSLTAKVWEKIELEATRDHLRIPLMVIDLKDSYRVVVFKASDFGFNKTNLGYTDDTTRKSYRVTYYDCKFAEQENCINVFQIKGTKNNVLCSLPIKSFIERYGEIE